MGNRLTGLLLSCAVVLVLACLMATPASAVPDLQIYIEGATYDPVSQTWVTGDSEFDLQVIGANDQIYDVKLAAALIPGDTDPGTGSITFTPVGFTPGAQIPFTYGTPLLGDGSSLPGHGIYPAYYTVLPIGDFTPTYDVYNMPDMGGPVLGEIKTIHVEITGYDKVHFDAYNHVISGDHARYISNPFSHDGEGGGDGGDTPEPGTLALLSLGLTGALAVVRRRRAD
jgi:hypothetical protein